MACALAKFGLVVLLIPHVLATDQQQSSTKLRRDGLLNIFPFPRVGRSKGWLLPLQDLILEYKPNHKREFYAFPRVGRNEEQTTEYDTKPTNSNSQVKSNNKNMVSLIKVLLKNELDVASEKRGGSESAMWFGPRLGRSDKSMKEAETIPAKEINTSEPEQIEYN